MPKPKIIVKKWNPRLARYLYCRMIKNRTHPLAHHLIETPTTIAYKKRLEEERIKRMRAEANGRVKPIY